MRSAEFAQPIPAVGDALPHGLLALAASALILEAAARHRRVTSSLGGRQHGLLDSSSAEQVNADAKIIAVKKIFREPRPHAASAAELLLHVELIKKLKNPVWETI